MKDSSDNRYARQIRFDPIGADGQKLISEATVSLLGCGALGTVAAEILARSGVGRLRIIDRDVVEWSNLQRQALFDENDAKAGRSKSAAAAERIAEINSEIHVEPMVADVTASNIESLLAGSDLVIDATDNFSIRFLLNDWSLKHETAWVHGGCIGASGQVRLFDGKGKPCFRCLVPSPPPAGSVATCDTAGVVGPATHLIASLQATEAIKWISGNRNHVRSKVLSIDLWDNRIREIDIPESLSKNCPACGQREYEFLSGEMSSVDDGTTVLCGRDAVQITATSGENNHSIDLELIADRWAKIGPIQRTAFFVRMQLDEPEAERITLFRDGRVIVDGTEDPAIARIIRDRYLG
ncbi:Molybdopterin-synthase adenylyltransferase [Rubripirellula obstinata]|uniref:Molybdopterin-synthase adenylyltransferase n=1 Tax=Rubripirellula obstinata TaxID=406547 RepID=A0A5B1CJY8_9BACT|nr:ThiF family adenylyltransferase [Rubripirellula obstinata]KAA1261497.1 Molybdopterin-synthase adenylyltransferase [Rubripirellula obstinata]